MATLVLTTLGTALGGPVGGALGGIIGHAIDENLFGPPTRRGPRLGDLIVQTSSYGTPIPRIYGRMRVSGTVVWATDLKESEVASGGGKGSPGAVNYAYSASFAVALSSRRAESVGRIWADGKLLRGADGKFKSTLTHRFYPGSEDQPVDPLIASIEGAGGSPAFRGMTLAVFEDMALADYGNRIPSLTFEVTADADDPRVGDVIRDISAGVIAASDDPATLVGYAAMGSDRRAAIEPLAELWNVNFRDAGAAIETVPRDGEQLTLGDPTTAGCVAEGDRPAARIEREQEAADSLPAALTIDYYDPARDFQAGQMRATSITGGRSQRRIDSASALGADVAKSLAHDALARRWAGRDQVTLRLAPSLIWVRPGQLIELIDMPGLFRIEAVTLDGLIAIVEARRAPPAGRTLSADPGRANTGTDFVIGHCVPRLLDLPAMGAGADQLGLSLAVGSDGAFKPAAVELEVNGQPLAALRVDRPAVTGVCQSALGPGSTNLVDRINSVDVALSNPGSLLYNADGDGLAMGANLLSVGSEIMQFGRATALAGGGYRLSELVRGRYGTEWAVGDHEIGETVVLLDAARIMRVPMDPAMLGASVVARAYGVADDTAAPPTAMALANGECLRPMSPCHVEAVIDAASWTVRWVARRVALTAWSSDYVGSAQFEVAIRRGSGTLRRTTSDTSLAFTSIELAALGSGAVMIEVVELGVLPSRAASLSVNS